MMVRTGGRPVRREVKQESGHNRAAHVATVVFLLLGALAFRLAWLQVAKHEQYALAASDQHLIEQSLRPERGKIYITDNAFDAASQLYPLAINKDFASLFAVPRDVDDPAAAAEKLYVFFREAELKKEVEARLGREADDRLKQDLETVAGLPAGERSTREAAIKADHAAWLKDPVYLDFRNEKRDLLIEEGHKAIVADYTAKLDNPQSQYQLIEKKLDEDKLKQFYLFMLDRTDLVADKMTIGNGKVYGEDGTEIKLAGFGYAMNSFRYYPEKNIGANILGFASYENDEQRGHYGLEGFFDDDLYGQLGSVKSERGAGGLVIVNNRQRTEKTDGSSLVLTIDRSAQFTSCRLLDEAVARHGASGGSVIIVEPNTGAILAMCSAPDFDPNNYQSEKSLRVFNNPSIFNEYEPGSVFKSITMAAALDQEKVTPETTYQDNGQIMINGWPKPIRNSDFETHGGHGVTNMVTVLEQSLNTGAIFAMEKVGVKKFADYVRAFGFGEKTGIELEGESDGNISSITGNRVKEISAATASFGQGITVTPLQMVMSYVAIANGGNLYKPYIVKEIIAPDGTRTTTQPSQPQRVISERAASLLTGMLVNVVENGHSKAMHIDGYYTAGKTGTAQVAAPGGGYSSATDHTFIGFAPANNPKFVILTELDRPKARYAESTAVPLARDITKFLLNHWQVKKDRTEDKK